MKCGNCIWLNVKNNNTSCVDEGVIATSNICKHFDNIHDRIIQIKKIVAELPKTDAGNWLDNFNSSQAFLICIGAGPWRINRRLLIQKQAIEALGNKDLAEINDILIFKYPLTWQNQKVSAVIDYLQKNKITMVNLITILAGSNEPAKILYDITKTKGRAKVLDLFVRDYLKINSFPIDRWVDKRLKENNLPKHENYMIELCKKAELDPSDVARRFVINSGFTGNVKD